jgi:hypothetical protein
VNTDVYAQVYAFVRQQLETHRHTPDAKQTYATLGLTKREYYAALRWLLRYRFLVRDGTEWCNAKVNFRYCDCGAEITPASAAYTTVNSKLYMRRPCKRCYQARRTQDMARWREQNPGYNTRLEHRRRRQHRSASA